MPNVVDVVIVTYNSARTIRQCLEPLLSESSANVIVVDNASTDGTVDELRSSALTQITLDRNRGFAAGCNAGWRAGMAPYVLFLNPDARINANSLGHLVRALDLRVDAGAVGPKIVDDENRLQFSLRRFPRLGSTYAQALFLHHVSRRSAWTDEVVRDWAAYDTAHAVEWVSGACILARRSALEEIEGFDESFFMYGEDTDLCMRLWQRGRSVLFEPSGVVCHTGGHSAPRSTLVPTLAWSRVLYARKHFTRTMAALHTFGIALGSGLRIVVSRGGLNRRAAHARAFWVLCTGRPRYRSTGQPTGLA